MLRHLSPDQKSPSRVVVIGAAGFVGSTLTAKLQDAGVPTLAVTRAECDLLADTAADTLTNLLEPDDAVAFISAAAPVKNSEMLANNIAMARTVIAAITKQPVSHLLYISSDAVYKDVLYPMTEEAAAEPASLHGVMHLAREVMLANELPDIPLAILRPTLIYGARDPHNGYGPNQFRRLLESGQDIKLFGEGEERRDHILVDDVAELARLILMHRSTGKLNAATGTVTSFNDVAKLVVRVHGASIAINGSPRNGSMPHNGYRAFDPAGTAAAFPDFQYTSLEKGLRRTYEQDKETA